MPIFSRKKLCILLILSILQCANVTVVGSVSVTNILKVLDEQKIQYNKVELQNAAINGMLHKIDTRAGLLTTNDLSAIEHNRAELDFEQFKENIGYIKINGIYQDTDRDICSFIVTNNCITGNILDLRGASGDNLEAVAAIMSCFYTNRTFLFSVKDNAGSTTNDYFTDISNKIAKVEEPLMVLINGETSDASVVLAALLKGIKNVLLLGETTAPPRGFMDVVPLNNEELLYLPLKFTIFAGNCCSNGVEPDVTVTQAKETDEELPVSGKELIGKNISVKAQNDRKLMERVKDDTVLQRAVDLLLGIKAVKF